MQKPFHIIDISNIDRQCTIKKSIANVFPHLTTGVGKSKNLSVNVKFLKNYQVTHQKD